MSHEAIHNLPKAPAWSLAAGELGKWAIFLACACFALVVLSQVFRSPRMRGFGKRSFWAGCSFLFLAFMALAVLFVADQFHFRYVFSHSDAETTWPYKVAAIWSGQEGSFLLWACCSAVFGLVALPKALEMRRGYLLSYAAFLGGLSGILAYESPFLVERINGEALLPPTGLGMAPSLHNYWVTIHPPTIFLGFGSLAVLFALSIAAMVANQKSQWIAGARPFAILSMVLLGLGLCMGGFWAYETLGWGGFWAWDPVENVSFVPWCLVIVFVHGMFVQSAKQGWTHANLLFAGLPFLSFLYGTFLTRSGFLGDTSVHSFAEMNRGALWLLIGMFVVSLFGFLALWWRSLRMNKSTPVAEVHEAGLLSKREIYGVAAWLMVGFAVTAAFGMSYPFLQTLLGREPAVVEPWLYHRIFFWLFVATMAAMAIAPWLNWKGESWGSLFQRLSNVLAISIGVLGLVVIWIKHPQWGAGVEAGSTIQIPFGFVMNVIPLMAIILGFCIFALISNIWFGMVHFRRGARSLGGIVMHAGVIITLTGLIVSRGFERVERVGIQPQRPASALGYQLVYEGPTKQDFMDRGNKIRFLVEGQNRRFKIEPGLYYIPQQDRDPSPMVWPYIKSSPFYDLYFSIGPMVFDATDPIQFKVGESKLFEEEQILLKYNRKRIEGEPGTQGVRFGAEIAFQSPEGTKTVVPKFKVGENGPEFEEAIVNDDLSIRLLRMDAKDNSISVQLHYRRPLFPMEVFYKPMTSLVWGGAGIMTLGGVFAALFRWKMLRRSEISAEKELQDKLTD